MAKDKPAPKGQQDSSGQAPPAPKTEPKPNPKPSGRGYTY